MFSDVQSMTEQLSDHTTDAYALQVQGLTKRYGDLVAVDDLTLQIKKGEIFGFLGPNGAGKTTAINMMVGLLSPTGGAVLINGQDRARVPKRSIGICPQEIVLWEELTCVENLTVIGDMYDLPRAVTNERVRSLLADLALSEKANARVSQLSGGMKRRLNVALAVIHNPDIVVLDELCRLRPAVPPIIVGLCSFTQEQGGKNNYPHNPRYAGGRCIERPRRHHRPRQAS